MADVLIPCSLSGTCMMFTFKKDEIGICERDMLKGFKLIYFQVQRYIVILLGSVCNIISLCKIEFGHIIHDFFFLLCAVLCLAKQFVNVILLALKLKRVKHDETTPASESNIIPVLNQI